MQRLTRLLGCALVAAAAFATPAFAHGYKIGDLSIGHPWARATPGGAKIGGGYLTITNNGSAPDRLTGGALSAADHVELHEMKMDGGVMQMRPIEGGVEIKPGETVKFEPSGNHLMFMGLKEPLKQGDMVKGQLTFEKAGTVDVEYKVDAIGASGPSGEMKMDGMKDMDNMH
ncbi:MAG: copper chaperone PCu(A)C [Xanthobacteraceae bacterium]|nr:copper chaperone PCu(A)C [Xanthobacteraceae bacterium]